MDKLQKIALKQQIDYQEAEMQKWSIRIIEHVGEIQNLTEELSQKGEAEMERLAEEDLTALECLVEYRMENAEIQKAYQAVLKGIKNNSRFCAETLEVMVDTKSVIIEEKDMLLLYGLLEQAFYHKYYKILAGLSEDKLKSLNQDIFNSAVNNAIMEAYAQNNERAAVTLKVERATKSIPTKVHDKTYVISFGYGSSYSVFGIYFFFDHNKKSSESEIVSEITNMLDNATDKIIKGFKPSSLTYNILGKETVKFSSVEGDKAQSFYSASGNIKAENVNVKVEKSEGGALSKNMCSYCGRPLKDGSCDYCGATNEQPKKGNSYIDRNGNFVLNLTESENGELKILNCSQCSSPIKTNAADGDNVVCSFCGASFLMNKQAFTLTHGGIIRKQMEQDKPKNENFPAVTFSVRPLYNGRLGITMPEEFTVMDSKIKALKYPRGNPPELVLTDERGATNYTFSPMYNAVAKESEIGDVGVSVLGMLRKMMPAASVGERGILKAGEHNISYFELITPANEDIYNLMLHFNLSGTLMTASFNCLAKDRWFWAPVFLLAAKSIKFDD